jgi:hypothetical protein
MSPSLALHSPRRFVEGCATLVWVMRRLVWLQGGVRARALQAPEHTPWRPGRSCRSFLAQLQQAVRRGPRSFVGGGSRSTRANPSSAASRSQDAMRVSDRAVDELVYPYLRRPHLTRCAACKAGPWRLRARLCSASAAWRAGSAKPLVGAGLSGSSAPSAATARRPLGRDGHPAPLPHASPCMGPALWVFPPLRWGRLRTQAVICAKIGESTHEAPRARRARFFGLRAGTPVSLAAMKCA